MTYSVIFGGLEIDVRPHVLAAVKLFGPHLERHTPTITADVVNAHNGRRTDWKKLVASEVDAHLLSVITVRASHLAYAEYRRRQIDDPAIIAYRPQGRFKAGLNACAQAVAIDGVLFPTTAPQIPPLESCRTEVCTCTFKALSRRQMRDGK